ncbi:MAG: CYTH domain-containing protein [Patescibacteria group bacterium]
MAQEIETKVLDIHKDHIISKLKDLGAKEKGARTKLTVDWFRKIGITEGQDPWYLRIRSYDDNKHEVTWKAKSVIEGNIRKHKEINFMIEEPKQLKDLFEEIELENYAHQEKYRTSFTLKDWQFDIDEYPGMPAFIEIEGQSEEHINEAMELLDIKDNKTWTDGERTLVQDVYGLDWYKMKF